MQERFPGVGNWMADEILWRAALHPRRPAGTLGPGETRALWRECRWVAREALQRIVGKEHRKLPGLVAFQAPRWQDGGRCPRTGALLRREQVGGRTTCWSPGRQHLDANPRRSQATRPIRSGKLPAGTLAAGSTSRR